jgi:hypothetical protein
MNASDFSAALRGGADTPVGHVEGVVTSREATGEVEPVNDGDRRRAVRRDTDHGARSRSNIALAIRYQNGVRAKAIRNPRPCACDDPSVWDGRPRDFNSLPPAASSPSLSLLPIQEASQSTIRG